MMGSASQMKIQAVLVFILISAVAGKKQRFPEESLQQYRDSYTVCSGTSAFDVSYDYTGVPNDSILSLDAAKGLAVVECDIDNSSINLKFATQLDSAAFAAALLKAPFKTFVTSRFKYPGCPTTDLSLVRRVMTVWPDEEDNVNLLVGIADAKYDELIKDGTISIMPKGPCTLPPNSSAAVGVDQKICIGLNVKDDCRSVSSVAFYGHSSQSFPQRRCRPNPHVHQQNRIAHMPRLLFWIWRRRVYQYHIAKLAASAPCRRLPQHERPCFSYPGPQSTKLLPRRVSLNDNRMMRSLNFFLFRRNRIGVWDMIRLSPLFRRTR